MKKLFISLIIICFLNINFLFTQDNTTDKNFKKSIEFNIGGGFKQAFTLIHKYYFEEPKYYNFYGFQKGSNFWPYGQNLIVTLPVSFIYYPLKFFGIGLTYNLGLNIFLKYSITYGYFGIINNIYIINKFGNVNKKKFFILEYGLVLEGCFRGDLEYGTFYNTIFYVGPGILVGYEKTFKNNLNYTVGFTFESTFSYRKKSGKDIIVSDNYYGLNDEINEDEDLLFNFLKFGIEFRWRYSFYKNLK